LAGGCGVMGWDIDKSKEVNEQIEYGLNSVNNKDTVEVGLKDFMKVYNTFSELIRFFHQEGHYHSLKDIHTYIGNVDYGAFAAMSEIFYKILPKYIPKEIDDKFGDLDDPFDNPKSPYYFFENFKDD
jgi:hypothetical protein